MRWLGFSLFCFSRPFHAVNCTLSKSNLPYVLISILFCSIVLYGGGVTSTPRALFTYFFPGVFVAVPYKEESFLALPSLSSCMASSHVWRAKNLKRENVHYIKQFSIWVRKLENWSSNSNGEYLWLAGDLCFKFIALHIMGWQWTKEWHG